MEPIDELIPLTTEDLKILEANKTRSNLGYGIFALFIFLLAAGGVWYLCNVSFWLTFISGGVSFLFLIISALIFWLGPSENMDVLLDICEGKKRRIVAPIETKEVIEIVPKTPNYRNGHVPSPTSKLIKEIKNSSAPLNLEYWVTIKGFKFPLSEKEYLTRFRKGSLVEFHVTPHSKTILLWMVEID